MDRHVILTLGRSGSNTLVNTLNQHPQLLNIGEVLGDWNRIRQIERKLRLYGTDTTRYLDATTSASALVRLMSAGRSAGRLAKGKIGELKPLSRIQNLGIKEFATLMTEQGAGDYLTARSDLKVIGLMRDNVLDRLISYLRLEKTGQVLTTDGPPQGDDGLLRPNPQAFLTLLETVDRENQLLQSMLDDLPESRKRVVHYDRFYQDEASRQAIMEELFGFLGVPAVTTRSKMKKIITKPPQELLANRAACAAALKGTRFEGLLD